MNICCKIRFETPPKRSKTDQNGGERTRNTLYNPSRCGFLLNYEVKRWSKENFFYINKIAIFRRSWRYHWFAPGSKNKRDTVGAVFRVAAIIRVAAVFGALKIIFFLIYFFA